ncbi:hypothetical protein WG954_19595 [Lacibacter sp. H375]|uniref:NACHT domain-containing protein n=1 Tax=Lacibacter sp. H375 TaxID=3133424 RepID=UPI0030BEA73A
MVKDFLELFKVYAKIIGLEEDQTNRIVFLLLLIIVLMGVVSTIYVTLKRIVSYYWNRRNNKDLHPFFSYTDVKKATKFYISTKYQNISPSEDEEPTRRYIASAKDKLMPLFLKKVFPYGKTDNKYYLLLADSGMGKTTFLINLYIEYKNRFRWLFSKKAFDIKLIPIWHHDATKYIEKVKDPENTILLLDAFDESTAAQKNYFLTLKNILLKVSSFRLIIITCRTQFFPSQKEEPHETGYFTAGEKGEYYFQKLYISPFDDKDVNKYLKNRFPYIWQRNKYLKAKDIARRCPNLLIRPMLLNHIEEIMEDKIEFEFTFQIYDALISSWIRRESKKTGIKEKYKSEKNFIRLLIDFSEKFSINLYQKSNERDGYYLPQSENFAEGELRLEEFDDTSNSQMEDIDKKSKSLLTRNANGDYRFSHKSILEYFLAKAIFDKHLSYHEFNFTAMDMVKLFHKEMLIHKLSGMQGNIAYHKTYLTKQQQTNLESLNIKRITDVKTLTVKDVGSIQLEQFSIFNKLEKLLLLDEVIMKDVYQIYVRSHLYFLHLNEQIEQQILPKGRKEIWENSFNILEENQLIALKRHLQHFGLNKTKKLLKELNITITDEMKNTYNLNESKILENVDITKLKKANKFIEEAYNLMERLPNTEIIF